MHTRACCADKPVAHAALRLLLYVLAAFSLNGCAALAVSLAGAGAGAGLSHQINGTVSRTFSQPFDKVDRATRTASKRLYLEVLEVASLEGSKVTTAKVSDLDVTLELETLSPRLTRVSVRARKNIFRVDTATAQEIIMQIEQALGTSASADANDGRSSAMNAQQQTSEEAPANRKARNAARAKRSI